MNTQQAILATLEDSGAANYTELVETLGLGAAMPTSGVAEALYALVRAGLVGVECGVYRLNVALMVGAK